MPIDFSAIARGAKDKLNQSGVAPYMLPAAVGAAAGGPLMAYFSSKQHHENETGSQRRQRILRNALLGLTLGGAAGAAIPAGLHELSTPLAPQEGFHPTDALANAAVRHWAPAAVGGAGAVAAMHHLGGNRERASIFGANLLHPEGISPRTPGLNTAEDKMLAAAHAPESQGDVITRLSKELAGGSTSKVPYEPAWRARELMNEMGVNTSKISEAPIAEQGKMVEGLTSHLGNQGPISRLMGQSVDALAGVKQKLLSSQSPAAKWLAGALPKSHVPAEMYSRYMRPSIGSRLGSGGFRLGMAPTIGLVGAGMLGADYAQNKLQGN